MSIRKRLLATPPERVPDELGAAVRAFCEPFPEIRAAYVGLTEVTRDFDFPVEELAVAIELVSPPTAAEAGDAVVREIALRFFAAVPETMREGGCSFLGEAALPVWHELALQVFAR